jgi:adenylate cyclase
VRRPLFGWEALLALLVAMVMLLGLATVADLGPAMRLESLALDARFRLRHRLPPPVPIVIVKIDDGSIAELGRWPWSRALFARFLDRMRADGSKVVAFDLLFSEPQSSPLTGVREKIDAAIAPFLTGLPAAEREQFEAALGQAERSEDTDAALAGAIGRNGAVILPFAFDAKPGGAASADVPPAPDWLENAEYSRVRGAGPDRLPTAGGLRLPLAELARVSTLAHVTVFPDASGGFHYDYPVLRYDDAYFPSLSLEAVRNFLGVAKINVVIDLGRGIELGSLHIPTDEGMRLLVNSYPPGAFSQVSFADALMGRTPASTFAGKIVLVGATAAGLGDVLASPYSPEVPSVERHASLIANMLDHDFLKRDSRAQTLDALAILSGGVGVGLASTLGMIAACIAAAALLAGVMLLDYSAFVNHGLWLNFIFPASTVVFAFGLILAGKYIAEGRRERRIRLTFSRYLHPQLVDELCRSRTALSLGGEERELTVLFADVRDFAAVAEKLSATELVALMNEFFAAMTDVILGHRGMLDKYIGDSLMAIFGAPLPDSQHARRACRAAIEMRSALLSLHARWRVKGWPCLEMRVGINTGRMVIGNIGTERRSDYTVMGDEVNVASRLEGANKTLGTDILISATTAAEAGRQFILAPRGAITVKGRRQPVEAFELLAFEGETAESDLPADRGHAPRPRDRPSR